MQADDAAQWRLATNTNVGWILNEDESRVVMAHGVSTSGEVDVFSIPTVNIIERVPLISSRKSSRGGNRDEKPIRQRDKSESD
jgi:hypothetical protein